MLPAVAFNCARRDLLFLRPCAGLGASIGFCSDHATEMNRVALLLFAVVLSAAPVASRATGWAIAPELRDRAWTDSDGREVRLSGLRAPLYVVTMAYTACHRICGTTTLVLSEIQRRIDALGVAAEFVVVSYDPANDTPSDWRSYRARRGLTRSTWHFLTGDAATTRTFARALDLDFWSHDDHIVHGFRIALFDSGWRPVGEVDWAHVDDVASIIARLPRFASRTD